MYYRRKTIKKRKSKYNLKRFLTTRNILILTAGIFLLALFIYVVNNLSAPSRADYDSFRVGLHTQIPGLSSRKHYDEPLKGFEVDLAKAIAKDIYANEQVLQIVEVNAKTAKAMLSNNMIDAVICQQTAVKDDSNYSYSSPYFKDNIRFVYKDGAYDSIGSLSGKKVGVITKSFELEKLKAYNEQEKSEIEIIELSSYSDAQEMIDMKNLDAFCSASKKMQIFDSKEYKLIPEDLGNVEYCVVTRIEDTDLTAKIDDYIKEITENGKLDKIKSEWI